MDIMDAWDSLSDGFVRQLAAKAEAEADVTKHTAVEFSGKEVLARHYHVAWIAFLIIFVGLALFDMKYLAPHAKTADGTISDAVAGFHVLFWFVVGLVFNIGTWIFLGQDVAVVWFNGYLLEYLLSMDNVFFFHVVFTAYATPPKDLYRGLFLGILGAVVLRLLFYLVGSHFFRAAFVVQFGFGVILVWSGYKTAISDEDDDDPRENTCVQFMTRCLPITGTYEKNGLLFVKVPKNAPKGPDANVVGAATTDASGGTVDPEMPMAEPKDSTGDGGGGPLVWRGTMLLLVVLVLQVIDVIFAVDSVTAKIAEYDSIFINFTSSAFAMLCLRSLYFVFTKLLKYFHYLKYGVAAILCMIGLKLMVSPWIEVPSEGSLIIICTFFAISIMMSALMPPPEEYNEMDEENTARNKDEQTPAPKPTEGTGRFGMPEEPDAEAEKVALDEDDAAKKESS